MRQTQRTNEEVVEVDRTNQIESESESINHLAETDAKTDEPSHGQPDVDIIHSDSNSEQYVYRRCLGTIWILYLTMRILIGE